MLFSRFLDFSVFLLKENSDEITLSPLPFTSAEMRPEDTAEPAETAAWLRMVQDRGQRGPRATAEHELAGLESLQRDSTTRVGTGVT